MDGYPSPIPRGRTEPRLQADSLPLFIVETANPEELPTIGASWNQRRPPLLPSSMPMPSFVVTCVCNIRSTRPSLSLRPGNAPKPNSDVLTEGSSTNRPSLTNSSRRTTTSSSSTIQNAIWRKKPPCRRWSQAPRSSLGVGCPQIGKVGDEVDPISW